jgi:hypothetical protein
MCGAELPPRDRRTLCASRRLSQDGRPAWRDKHPPTLSGTPDVPGSCVPPHRIAFADMGVASTRIAPGCGSSHPTVPCTGAASSMEGHYSPLKPCAAKLSQKFFSSSKRGPALSNASHPSATHSSNSSCQISSPQPAISKTWSLCSTSTPVLPVILATSNVSTARIHSPVCSTRWCPLPLLDTSPLPNPHLSTRRNITGRRHRCWPR